MKMRNTLENKNIEKPETATPRLMLRLLALALLVVGGWSGAVFLGEILYLCAFF